MCLLLLVGLNTPLLRKQNSNAQLNEPQKTVPNMLNLPNMPKSPAKQTFGVLTYCKAFCPSLTSCALHTEAQQVYEIPWSQ